MAGKNLSPRQQMIGLMYLVLLAMLAMNASKDLLNAFIFLDEAINVTNDNLDSGNETVFKKIESSAALGSEKAVTALNQATQIKKSSGDLTSTITLFKKDIIDLGGGTDAETGIPLGKDNQDVGAEYIMTNKKGEELKLKLEQYKKQLVSFIDPKDSSVIQSIQQILATPPYEDYEKNQLSWESGISEHLPLVAVTANLSNIETYVQNAETQVLNYLYEGIALDTYKVNKILATSTSKKSYVLQGDAYNANVFLAAADTTQEPIILIGEYDTLLFEKTGKVKFLGKVDSLPVRGGIGKYVVETDEVGAHSWGGIMKVPHPNPKRKGEFLMYPFKSSYTVAAPTAVISSEQLNIMYLGLNNEISVSAPGISSDKLEVKATNRCVVQKKSNGKYTFKPGKTGKITIQVFVKENGISKQISSQNWTGKRLPKPRLTLLKKEIKRSINKNKFKVPGNQKFETSYPPSFPLSGKIKIEKCTVSCELDDGWSRPYKLINGVFSKDFKNLLDRMKRGKRLEISMKVRGQDNIPYDIDVNTKLK